MYLIFDIGGTKMRVAASSDGRDFGEPKILETPQNFQQGVGLLVETARILFGGEKIEMAAGGVAGPLDQEHSKLVNAPQLPDWIDKPLKAELSERLQASVWLENDAALAGLGEAVRGAGRGFEIVAYLTVSTGLGGARIVDGAIDRSRFGFEPGHQIIDPNGLACPACLDQEGGRGHLEGYLGGRALEERFGRPVREIADREVWDEAARFLAIGLNNLIVHWSPDIIVLGGPQILGQPAIDLEKVREKLRELMTIFPELPEIKKAELADFAGLYGSLVYLRQRNV